MTKLVWGRVFGVLSQLAGIGLLLASAWLIVRAAEQPPVLYLMVAIVSVRFFGLSRAALRYVERLLTHDAAFARVTEARIAVYRDLDRIAPAGVPAHRRGDLVSRVVSDVDAVQDRMLRLRGPWIIAIAAALAVTGVAAAVDPASAGVVGVSSAIAMIIVRIAVPWSVRRAGDRSQWRGDLAADVAHGVLAAPDLVAHGATSLLRESAHRSIDRLADAQRRTAQLAGLGEAVVLACTGAAVATIAALSSGLDPVLVGVVLLAPLALIEPLTALAEAEALRPAIESAERRLAELEHLPAAIVDPVQPCEAPAPFSLELRDLAIGWDTTLATGVDLVVDEGEILAVTGPSGAGKSTLALTLARLVEPRGGAIVLGGTDVRDLAASDVRSTIGYLAQDEIVFDTTIRENLRIADPSATDEELLAALQTAGLQDFVASVVDPLDVAVGEGGRRLSGGERQRLCLARLVLGGHRVLLLDEPTEHLDERAADALLDDILALAPDRSIVVVTHSPRVLERLGRSFDLVGSRLVGAS